MHPLAFEKYEGLGNDFVVIRADDEGEVPTERARSLCDRRFGVGADGVLLVLPPRSPGSAGRMRVLNADGSVPEMCGNGLRCVALFVARERGLRESSLLFETDAGPRACDVVDDGIVGTVTIDMGVVRWTRDLSLDLGDIRLDLALADAGNPHAVTFAPQAPEAIDRLGPAAATHPFFAAGTNVEFARIRNAWIDVTVWERGVGLTLACGTGACATVAVACEKGLVPWDRPMTVRLPGGPLSVTMKRENRHAIMRGPARRVFRGEWTGR